MMCNEATWWHSAGGVGVGTCKEQRGGCMGAMHEGRVGHMTMRYTCGGDIWCVRWNMHTRVTGAGKNGCAREWYGELAVCSETERCWIMKDRCSTGGVQCGWMAAFVCTLWCCRFATQQPNVDQVSRWATAAVNIFSISWDTQQLICTLFDANLHWSCAGNSIDALIQCHWFFNPALQKLTPYCSPHADS